MKKNLYWFFMLIAPVAIFSQSITSKVLNPPNQMRCTDAAPKLNQILYGSVPPNSDDKPVVVFIHGWFDNGYSWFMTKNDWYKRCYDAGYKTAFYFQSPNGTFQDNGQMIADMIRQTCAHYNTHSVIAVCHSKGGFDIEWALYNSGIWDSVQGVITLSTPFWGAPMADLIANPGIRSALSIIPIVGPIFQGDGTYQMQPAYMAGVVRPMLDNHPDNHPEKFRCFASWGYDHVLRIPNQINTDILMVVFPDYRPACGDFPFFNVIAGNLMSGFMNITGQLSKYVGVQEGYNNPAGDVSYVDGLAPYYSSIRPGAFNFSEPPPSTMSKINHLDVLYAFEMWQYVQPQIDYCWHNPVLKIKKENDQPQQAVAPDNSSVSNFQFVQDNKVTFTKKENNASLILVGLYADNVLKIWDGNTLVKTVSLKYEIQGVFDAFHSIDLNDLEANKSYTITCDKQMTALLNDGGITSLKIKSGIYYAGDALNIKAVIENAEEPLENIIVTGYLNRNLDEYGHVVADKNIPVSFKYDAVNNVFVCVDQPELPKGIYNISIFANGNVTHRFATTSVALLTEKKNYTSDHSIDIYPNPTRSQVTLNYELKTSDNLSVMVYDLSGKLVLQNLLGYQISGKQSVELSLDVLSKGTYIIQLNGTHFQAREKLCVF